jgi:hypothetical protein
MELLQREELHHGNSTHRIVRHAVASASARQHGDALNAAYVSDRGRGLTAIGAGAGASVLVEEGLETFFGQRALEGCISVAIGLELVVPDD